MDGSQSRLPVARPSSEFVVETLPGEALVYDQLNHRAHCLTAAAVLVWKMCDGGPAQPARDALRDAGHAEPLEAVLAQLIETGLVRRKTLTVNRSRRALLGKTAVAAGIVLASPVVFSILSPSVAQAASVCGGRLQNCCKTNTPCTTGLHCTNTTVPPPNGLCIP